MHRRIGCSGCLQGHCYSSHSTAAKRHLRLTVATSVSPGSHQTAVVTDSLK